MTNRESLHKHAYQLATLEWIRRMRIFFIVELPASVLFVLLSWMLLGVIPITAHLAVRWAARLCMAAAVTLLIFVWIRRMPPERPSPWSPMVMSMLDRLRASSSSNPSPPPGAA